MSSTESSLPKGSKIVLNISSVISSIRFVTYFNKLTFISKPTDLEFNRTISKFRKRLFRGFHHLSMSVLFRLALLHNNRNSIHLLPVQSERERHRLRVFEFDVRDADRL